GRCGDRLDAIGRGQVGGEWANRAAWVSCGQLVQPSRVTSDGDHVVSLGDQAVGEGATDARGRACDECECAHAFSLASSGGTRQYTSDPGSERTRHVRLSCLSLDPPK